MLYAVSKKRSNVAFRTHKLHTYAADELKKEFIFTTFI